MGVAVGSTALTDLPRVKEHGKITGASHDQELVRLIDEVSARVKTYLGRDIVSQTYTHDGTTLPRLKSYGGCVLTLPQFPVTNVATLKLYPDGAALVEGWNQDFVVDADSGIVELVGGQLFWDRRGIVEVTYTAGLAATDGRFKELQLATAKQVVWDFNQKDREREGIASRSTEGGTFNYLTDAWLPEVQEILDHHARWRI